MLNTLCTSHLKKNISTPDRYVEIGGAVLHELSYQLAAYYNVPCKGVFVASCAGSK